MELNDDELSYLERFNDNSTDYDDCCGALCEIEEGMLFEAVFIPVLYSLALLVGVLGNSLLLWVLGQRSKNTWSVTDNFIVHLGVADSLLLATLPFWATQATPVGWVFGTPFCKIAGALFTVGFGLIKYGRMVTLHKGD